MKFVASRLSSGNKLFPAEIYLEPTGVTIKIPGLFSGETKHFDYDHIASVEIDTPLVGFSSITIFAGGTMMAANGFTKAEVKQIKEGIEKGKTDIKNQQREMAQNQTPTSAVTGNSLADELKKLKDLMDAGVITTEEFEQQKRKMLGQ
ncbi:SHOCT domain-containing protein [Flavobacterium silvisoli]|uniref:SHOCT domain-containing protein n=1 Tax=Flavobacterium silvisoli TaxID=2529433 RepID=A0A4Q9Z121_9FLAO|nr:SHOCT domain-containing protein [Flavobacterium silvisoli]TBX69922.1 SHOCT domain-containing protein [Flavobacterium silvisoli]